MPPSPISHLPSPQNRTAILITGHMRTFDRCLPTQYHHVFRHYPAADFFVSTINDADTHKAQLLHNYYGSQRVWIDVTGEQPALPLPAGCPPEESYVPGQYFMHEPYAISVCPQAILRQLWQLNQAWAHFVTAVQADGRQIGDYTTILRVRPDSYFHSYVPIDQCYPPCAYTPWWGRFGGINDRFALLSLDAAEAYHTTWRYLDQLVDGACPLHPESLIYTQLQARGIMHWGDLRAEFSTLKQVAGQFQVRPLEISPIDLAHLRS